MILVKYNRIYRKLSEAEWNGYLRFLPENLHAGINRFVRWQDRQARLFARMLLMEELKGAGYGADCLGRLAVDGNGRPFIEGVPDFNISHTDEYAVCAVSDRGKIGIDIERIRPIELDDFKSNVTPEQWKGIINSADRFKSFFDLWTKTECAMKADGRGLSIPFEEIRIDGMRAEIFGNVWFLRELTIRPGFSCHVATDMEHAEVAAESGYCC